MSSLTLTKFEDEVLRWLLAGQEPVLDALRRQLAKATVLSREFTGHGIYVNFHLPPDVKQVHKELSVKPRFCFGDVKAYIPSLQHGAGFLLWIEDGLLASLEGYTYDETWPETITDFRLRYVHGTQRDWDHLRAQWKAE